MSEANEHKATWEEMRKIHPWLPSSSEGWHQHANGGGWVQNTASVSDKARVYGEALVCGEARVYDEAQVCGEAQVYGKALVCGEAQVYGEALVYGKARVCGEAQVYGKARVYGEAQVYGKARVYGKALVCDKALVCGEARVSPLYIQGTRYWICYSGPGLVSSGCITKPLAWWLEHAERCGEEHGYTEQQQQEYRLHIEHVAAWMRLYGLDAEKPAETSPATATEKQGD